MKLYYDLHIHTALSPCSSDDMTPNNIVNMSILKELDVIGITDHNSTANCRACIEASRGKDILVIAGIELQTVEDVHILCFFKDVDAAEEFDRILDEYRMPLKNDIENYGNQMIMDKDDNHVADYHYPLFLSINITIKKTIELVKNLGGVVVPSHIDRKSFSIISSLGFIPRDYEIGTLELSSESKYEEFIKSYPYLAGYKFIRNSDSHDLFQISERENFMELAEKSIEVIMDNLK